MKKIMQKINSKACEVSAKLYLFVHDQRGEFSIGFILGIIAAVAIGGLLINAINKNVPGLFDGIFGEIKGKLDANW